MTPAGIEPATVRFVAQHLNHCDALGSCIKNNNTIYITIYIYLWDYLRPDELFTRTLININILIKINQFWRPFDSVFSKLVAVIFALT